MPEFTSSRVEEFYNHVHDAATGRFSGAAASGKRAKGEGPSAYINVGGKLKPVAMSQYKRWAAKGKPAIQNPGHLERVIAPKVKAGGHAVVGKQRPLRNSVTGRINPTALRDAFKTGGKSGPDLRTKISGGKVVTGKTYKTRWIQHVTSKGGADRAGFREGSHGTSRSRTVRTQRNLLAEAIARAKK